MARLNDAINTPATLANRSLLTTMKWLVPKPGLYRWESLNLLIGAAIPAIPLLDAQRSICSSLAVFVSIHPRQAAKVTP